MTVQTKAPESQFAYVVVLAARRARQIMAGAPPLMDNLALESDADRLRRSHRWLDGYRFTEPGSDEEKESVKRRR